MNIIWGIIVAGAAGSFAGGLSWPMKLMKQYKFEHTWFPAMLFGLFFLPWVITFIFCPNAIDAFKSLDSGILIKSNLFSLAWGIGNVLLGVSLVRIGASLSFAILSGIGIPLGVIVPMISKGTGRFEDAPDVNSPAGHVILAATVLMLVGVVLVAFAGFGRDRILQKTNERRGGFSGGLIMCIISGICSVGPAFAFVYSQDPIRNALMQRGSADWSASIAVWAVGMLFGSLVNVVYPAIVMSRNRSWQTIRHSSREFGLSLVVGFNLFLAFALWFPGMLLLGPLGGSVGFGIYFALQILAAQALGWLSGEWRGVKGKPVITMISAIAVLILAACLMGYASTKA